LLSGVSPTLRPPLTRRCAVSSSADKIAAEIARQVEVQFDRTIEIPDGLTEDPETKTRTDESFALRQCDSPRRDQRTDALHAGGQYERQPFDVGCDESTAVHAEALRLCQLTDSCSLLARNA
jgi:hypothetical protein